MNRGVVGSSPVQQMMAAGNPNWWNINHTMRPPNISHQPPSLPPNNSSPFFFSSTHNSPSSSSHNFISPYPPSSSLPFPSPNWHANQDQLPESWSHLLMGEEDKKMANWEEQVLMSQAQNVGLVDVKQESSSVNSYVYGGRHGGANNTNEEFQAATGDGGAANWSHHQIVPPPHPPTAAAAAAASSSPKSCVTSFSSNMLDFSSNKIDARHPPPDRSSESNSNGGGGAVKKARVQPSTTTQSSSFKVRKEKLGDRITALHQLVSPFGKTDTASVLLEAIGYIRFLQSQIEALSLPYLGTNPPTTAGSSSSSSSNIRQQHPAAVQGEKNFIFPEEHGQELEEEPKKDLKSRGLCLVPVSCTLQVGSDNGADYWAPALGGGFR